jgi:small multidrug resistance family-3 protein
VNVRLHAAPFLHKTGFCGLSENHSSANIVLMKIFLFVLMATVFEALGDAVIRIAITAPRTPVRVGFFVLGTALLSLYGTSLNLAPVEFATVTGLYIATLFVVFQLTNMVLFHTMPTLPVMVGGVLIISGGLTVYLWK